MSCVHKHQEQRYNNTKICMLIHYVYVNIFFPLTKAIPIMFERGTTHCQTLHTWIDHNATRYSNFALPYIVSQFSTVLELFAMGYHALPPNL